MSLRECATTAGGVVAGGRVVAHRTLRVGCEARIAASRFWREASAKVRLLREEVLNSRRLVAAPQGLTKL